MATLCRWCHHTDKTNVKRRQRHHCFNAHWSANVTHQTLLWGEEAKNSVALSGSVIYEPIVWQYFYSIWAAGRVSRLTGDATDWSISRTKRQSTQLYRLHSNPGLWSYTLIACAHFFAFALITRVASSNVFALIICASNSRHLTPQWDKQQPLRLLLLQLQKNRSYCNRRSYVAAPVFVVAASQYRGDEVTEGRLTGGLSMLFVIVTWHRTVWWTSIGI